MWSAAREPFVQPVHSGPSMPLLEPTGCIVRGSAESPSRVNSKLPLPVEVTVPWLQGGGERSMRSGWPGP